MKSTWIEDSKHEEIKILATRRKQSIIEVLDEIIRYYFEHEGIEVNSPPPIID